MMGHPATRPDDLRTASGRPRIERLRMKHCRRVLVELHQEKPPEAILSLARAAGLYSPRTCQYDALRSIRHYLSKINVNHE